MSVKRSAHLDSRIPQPRVQAEPARVGGHVVVHQLVRDARRDAVRPRGVPPLHDAPIQRQRGVRGRPAHRHRLIQPRAEVQNFRTSRLAEFGVKRALPSTYTVKGFRVITVKMARSHDRDGTTIPSQNFRT